MKKSLLLGLGAVAMALGGAARVSNLAFKQNVVSETLASGVSGTITIDLTGEGWASSGSGQHLSVYFWDSEHDDAEHQGWGSYSFTSENEFLAYVPYSLTFTPNKMKAVRYADWYTEERWEANRWGETYYDEEKHEEVHNYGRWGEGETLNYQANGNIVVAGYGNSFVGYAHEEGKTSGTGWEWSTLASLNSVRLNSKNHIEYYAELTITPYEEFLIGILGSTYGWSSCSFGDAINSSLWGASGVNIKYNNSSNLKVTIIFDRNAGTVTIKDPDYADADIWAEDFLGSGCAKTLANWATMGTRFSTELNATSRGYLSGLDHKSEAVDPASLNVREKAVQRYDFVYVYHNAGGTYTDFMERSSILSPSFAALPMVSESNGTTALVVTFAVISVSAIIGAFFLLRRKREQ